jgi:hypothetical protein
LKLRQKLEKERKIPVGDFVPKCLIEEENIMSGRCRVTGARKDKKRISNWRKREWENWRKHSDCLHKR